MRLNFKEASLLVLAIAALLIAPSFSWAATAGARLDRLFENFQGQMAQMNQQLEQFKQLQQTQSSQAQPGAQNSGQQARYSQMMRQPGLMQPPMTPQPINGQMQQQPNNGQMQQQMMQPQSQTQQPPMDQQSRENLMMLANQMSAFLDKVSNDAAFRQQLADGIAKNSQLWDMIGSATQPQNSAESQFAQKMKNDEQFRQQVVRELLENPQSRSALVSRAKDALNQVRMQVQNQ